MRLYAVTIVTTVPESLDLPRVLERMDPRAGAALAGGDHDLRVTMTVEATNTIEAHSTALSACTDVLAGIGVDMDAMDVAEVQVLTAEEQDRQLGLG